MIEWYGGSGEDGELLQGSLHLTHGMHTSSCSFMSCFVCFHSDFCCMCARVVCRPFSKDVTLFSYCMNTSSVWLLVKEIVIYSNNLAHIPVSTGILYFRYAGKCSSGKRIIINT